MLPRRTDKYSQRITSLSTVFYLMNMKLGSGHENQKTKTKNLKSLHLLKQGGISICPLVLPPSCYYLEIKLVSLTIFNALSPCNLSSVFSLHNH